MIGIYHTPPPSSSHIEYREIGDNALTEFGAFLSQDIAKFLRWARFLEL